MQPGAHPGLLTLPFGGTEPRFSGSPAFCGPGSSVLGRAELGAGVWLGGRACVRADGHFVRVGDRFWMGDRSTVHIAHDLYPTIIGDGVTVGRNACVHACTVGDDCVIEDDVVILDGSVLGAGVLVEAGSIVFGKSELAAGSVYAGFPAKRVGALDADELARRRARVRQAGTAEATPVPNPAALAHPEFVAITASLSGRVEIGAGCGVYFSCELDAGDGRIIVGENTNIQDNTVIACRGGDVVIGRDSTLGHNVRLLGACRIGERTLIGIGAVLAEGTVVEDDVLLGAGARTVPGQRIESGWLWGGDPARAIAPLDERKRSLIAWTIERYCEYSRSYRALQQDAARG